MSRRKVIAEAVALSVMGGGILMVWQPWVHALFRLGFPVTIIGIIGFMIASHLSDSAGSDAR